MAPQKVAAGLIVFRRMINQSVEYLLLQASYGIKHWSPPKGHLDDGETDLEAAVRETLEEAALAKDVDYTILNPADERMRIESHYLANGKTKRVVYWLAEVLKPDQVRVTLSDEHIDYKWAALEQACDLVNFDEMQRVLKAAHSLINAEIKQ